jgi:hypothetical protein
VAIWSPVSDLQELDVVSHVAEREDFAISIALPIITPMEASRATNTIAA